MSSNGKGVISFLFLSMLQLKGLCSTHNEWMHGRLGFFVCPGTIKDDLEGRANNAKTEG